MNSVEIELVLNSNTCYDFNFIYCIHSLQNRLVFVITEIIYQYRKIAMLVCKEKVLTYLKEITYKLCVKTNEWC